MYDAHRGSTGGEDALEQVFSELDHKEAAAAELRSRLERLRQEKPALAAGEAGPDGSRFLRLFRKGGGKLPFFIAFLADGV